MSVAVDPVQNPQAYQKMLIDLLGDDDPAEVQRATSASLRHVIVDAGDLLRTCPAQGEWSVIEVLGHMLDGEIISSARYRWVIAKNSHRSSGMTRISGSTLRVQRGGSEELLETFDALRAANLALWRRSTPDTAGHATECTPSGDPRASISCSG